MIILISIASVLDELLAKMETFAVLSPSPMATSSMHPKPFANLNLTHIDIYAEFYGSL